MLLNFNKLSILVAEDTVPMNKLVKSILDTLGFGTVYQAHNGEQAYELFCKHRPDIVLTDWVMSPVDGIELTRLIRTDGQSPNRMVPIIMLTGYSAIHRVVVARNAGVTEFLVKPLSAQALHQRVLNVIAHPRSFIRTQTFFGPDRRRTKAVEYNGLERRKGEGGEMIAPRKLTAGIVNS